jgi:peptide deformylase
MEWFRMLDANQDGCISRKEARSVIMFYPQLAKQFDQTDINRDGCLVPEEIRAEVERRRAERRAQRAQERARDRYYDNPPPPEQVPWSGK